MRRGTIGSPFRLSHCDELKKRGHAMKSRTNIIAIAAVLFLSHTTLVLAQTGPGGPGTGGGASTQPGTAPGTTNPGIVPPGGTLQSTTPPATNQGPGATSSSGTVGRSSKASTVEEKSDPVVEESEREVSRRIKSICKGC
jgi:hypothetical protein